MVAAVLYMLSIHHTAYILHVTSYNLQLTERNEVYSFVAAVWQLSLLSFIFLEDLEVV